MSSRLSGVGLRGRSVSSGNTVVEASDTTGDAGFGGTGGGDAGFDGSGVNERLFPSLMNLKGEPCLSSRVNFDTRGGVAAVKSRI